MRRPVAPSRGRLICLSAGLAAVAAALVGPLAERAHMSFTAHMGTHLLLGMIAPLLLVLGGPVTMLLRALPAPRARRVVAVLASAPCRVLTHPVTVTVLDLGGLWLLYTTPLYAEMHHHTWVRVAVHAHLLLAGYLFTNAFVTLDPMPHRPRRIVQAAVLVVAMAAHGILAKSIYAHPPAGVPAAQAESGAMLMYYGGDAVSLALVIVFCHQWYAAARPRPARGASGHDAPELHDPTRAR